VEKEIEDEALASEHFKSRIHEARHSLNPSTPPSPMEKEIEDEA